MGGGMRTAMDFWSRASKNAATGCLEWRGAKNPRGYGKIMRGGKTIAAHRHAYELSKGEIPHGKHVLHRCDNPSCVNPEHLFLGTQADNVLDMHAKGRARCQSGEAHYRSKLNATDVERIRDIWLAGTETTESLGRYFNVHPATIWYVVKRRSWREVA